MTYSLANLGISSALTNSVSELVTVDDAAAGQFGSSQNAMQTGAAFLCLQPDGSQALYQIDAERSTPIDIVLKRVGP